MEVYNESTIRIAKNKGFEVIFTQYRNPEQKCGMSIVNLCNKYGIKAIALALGFSWRAFQEKFIRILTDKNIKLFVFSTNSVSDYINLWKVGITGIFTDYLTEKDIKGK